MDDTARRLRDDESTTVEQDVDRDTARTTREIRSEIAQTRADMSETIEAIQDKLRPGNIAAAATDRLKNATSRAATKVADAASQTANATMTKTRQFAGNGMSGGNVARAMVGVGTAWLLVDHWRRSGAQREQWRDDPSYTASSRARETRELGTMAVERGQAAFDGFERLLRSNPLIVGAAALAIGAAVGLALPETEQENEWLGEAREELFEHAQDVARSTASQVRQAAGDIAGQVANEIVGGEARKPGAI